MLKLEVLDVIQAEEQPYPLVLLRHESRILPILVGMPEASAIQTGLRREKTLRPMTHDLICNIFAGLRAELESLTIYKLENDTFFAHLNLIQKNDQGQTEQILRIDSRPSDGIAIAVRLDVPIYAAESVMDQAAKDALTLGLFEEPSDDEESEPGFEED